jgi:hypothetical protein
MVALSPKAAVARPLVILSRGAVCRGEGSHLVQHLNLPATTSNFYNTQPATRAIIDPNCWSAAACRQFCV